MTKPSRSQNVVFNWSGGKDSALALHKMLNEGKHNITCLLTSISQAHQRISMHGVRIELLEAQADRIGIPLVKMFMPEMPSMDSYEKTLVSQLAELKSAGATATAFGDIFLEDLREYREKSLAPLDLQLIFPVWQIPTNKLIREFIDVGFKAVLVCVNDKYLDRSFLGRVIDDQFLNDLPENVDLCGENGEFHTFVFDGPIFSNPIEFEIGEIVSRTFDTSTADNRFWYCDLIPTSAQTTFGNPKGMRGM